VYSAHQPGEKNEQGAKWGIMMLNAACWILEARSQKLNTKYSLLNTQI
jgi:hypothetical protein